MAELKTKKTALSVEAFIKKLPDVQRQKDCLTIAGMMEKATKAEGKMWGTAIVGFGDKHMKYDSGREVDWFVIGFSPRKQAITLYISGAVEKQKALLKKLGKHKTNGGCLHINKLEEVDVKVLREIIQKGVSN